MPEKSMTSRMTIGTSENDRGAVILSWERAKSGMDIRKDNQS
jgi:hypothetical protein